MDRSTANGHGFAVRREGHVAAIRPHAVILRERSLEFAGVHVEEAEQNAGLSAESAQCLPVGRKCQTRNAKALLAVHEAAKLLTGFYIPEASEVVLPVLVAVVTAAGH